MSHPNLHMAHGALQSGRRHQGEMHGFESQSAERVPEILLTASALAKAVGCHQTTISRAVSSGHLIPDFLISTATGRPMIGFRIDRREEISAIIGHPACR